MNKKTNRVKFKNAFSMLLASIMLVGTFPSLNVHAAQVNEYIDPVDVWVSANGRTNELDMNATVTQETNYCAVCDRDTLTLTYRVPEYTKSGETALNRGVKFSDGTLIDGEGTGNLDDGIPGVDAFYTGYHFTKSVCQNCGTINAIEGEGVYSFNKNVYGLNSCDHNFFLTFDNTTYEPYSTAKHTTTLKRGKYCQFCKGTQARAIESLENHHFTETVDGQLGNSRFYVAETCDDCGFATNEYISAKSVVSSYYGVEDGESHTVTVADLSDSVVHTSIRYGTSAGKCNLTSAPNYTKAGYYPVYYEIDYRYAGESMTENGVSYVWILADQSNDNNASAIPHVHDYRYVETVAPSCTDLGFERWQCDGCGRLEKRNYTPATRHSYEDVTIREATCKQGGLVLTLCKKCGDFHEKTTPASQHKYKTEVHNPTCREVGYTNHICEMCGDNYITDITPLIAHAYERITKNPTCVDKGYTTSTCTMCGYHYVSDYTEPTGHEWDEGHTVTTPGCVSDGITEFHCRNCSEKMIKAESATGHTPGAESTCTEPQICEKCGTVLELPKGHHYQPEITKPTCVSIGFTTYTCMDCDDTYTADITDRLPHNHIPTVTAPTCTAMGFTIYTCADCGDEYVSDYTDKTPHHYKAETTPPTCTEMGYTTYTCENCGDSYTGDYTEMTEHNYDKQVIPPTCTEHGYSIFVCPDCGKEYIGDYTEVKQHHYTLIVTAPTCTEMGYTTYVCDDCGDTYKGEYKEALGHQPSDWIIDTPATIENAGSKHIECERCGEILQSVEIPQLIDTDNSDEDGNAEVGDYSIILTDKDGKPIFNSEITIDINDNVTIKLPKGRLLDYADQTTITTFYTDTQAAKADLQIFIYDENSNAATGKTNADGQLVVPNNQSSTGDDNGTIGKDEDEEKQTFVVTVTDKTNTVIPNCDIYIGESNNLVVDLPDGIKPTREYPVIITVTDQNGNAYADVTVITLGDADYIEKGVTDIYGKVTLPITSEGYTDENGKVNVNGINVIVNDEIGFIANAYVVHNEDGSINVMLPDEKAISYANRITVTVLDSIGKAMTDIIVTVNDKDEKTYTANTDENGQIVVPPLYEDMTDSDGKAVVNDYNVLITDEQKPIENAFVVIADGKISVKLPEGVSFDYANRITATITDKDNASVKDMSVTFTDCTEQSETNLTDENGKATVPPIHIDYTDVNGYSEVDGYVVTVVSETGAIEKAYVQHNTEIKNEDGTVKTAENVSVILPENVKFDYANRITVTVLNKADKTAVKDMEVVISEFAQADGEAKTLNGKTNANGKSVFPPLSEDITDDNGSSDITEEKPGKGEDTDGDGVEDKPGEIETVTYKVSVNDTKGIINNAFVEIKDGKVYVTLPDTHTLTTSNQTTVAVLDKDGKVVKGVSVTIKDKTTEKSGTTDANGKVTLPVKSSGGGGGSSRPSGGGSGGGGYINTNTTNVNVTDKDGKVVNASKSTDKDGNITLTLPTGKMLDNNYYTITTTDRNGKVKGDVNIILKDKSGESANGKTDKNGMLILPGVNHKAYIVGYDDGTFRPDSDMSRAEAAAIFARLIAEEKAEKISGKADFKDVAKNAWYADYIGYLAKYDIIKGYANGTFKPDAPVTRAEFVSMAVRYYGLFNDVQKSGYTVKYTDVASPYWAYADIAYAKHIGWLNGYADGTFRGDSNITRAEVVTVVNRATGRTADKEYVKDNFTKLNRFTDVTNNSLWYFFDVNEAAYTHKAVSSDDGETWVK